MNSPLLVGIITSAIGVIGTLLGVMLSRSLERRGKTRPNAGQGRVRAAGRLWKWRTSILLFATWWGSVGVLVGILHGFVEGQVIFGHVIHFDVLRVGAVVAIAVVDLFVRWAFFRRVQSISLSVLVVAFVCRLVIMMSACMRAATAAPEGWDGFILLIMFVLLFMGGSVYWLYRDRYVTEFRTWLDEKIPDSQVKLSDQGMAAFKKMAEEHKHIDLWGLFERPKLITLGNLLREIRGSNQETNDDEFSLSVSLRISVVVALSILPVLAVYLNALA